MVMMSPVKATMKPAPAETLSFLMVTVKSLGAPIRLALSEKEYWVLAIQIGSWPKPRSSNSLSSRLAAGVRLMPAPP